MLPMILIRPPVAQPGEMWFTLLDVGQGLSAVVQTRNHVLVYDAGPRFNEHFDTGSAVVEPFLRQKGVTKVDILIISHGDNDHIGGAQSIMDQIPVKEVITGVPEKLVNVDPQRCLSQTSWEWDGVNFQILYPTLDREANTKENDGSCVLKVTNRTGTLLLTGDIERSAENDLRKHQSNMLSADILVVPHHGSNTSSTAPFVQAVNPAYALFSVGYRNRFGFPKPKVVKRYRDLNVKLLDTAQMGAISFRFSNQNGLLGPENYRDINRHYWNAP